MNVILFKQIIQDAIVGEISEEMILCLIRAGMVLKKVNVWKTFAVARDSSDSIVTAINVVQKNIKAEANKETYKAKKKLSRKATNLDMGKRLWFQNKKQNQNKFSIQ